jgi:hypothetical protein
MITLDDALDGAEAAVFRYEQRGVYHEPHEQASIRHWRETGQLGELPRMAVWTQYTRALVDKGVTFRRVRVMPDPPTEYLRWEMALALEWNIPRGGEDIRVLDVVNAADLPDVDYWVIDHHVLVVEFADDGTYLDARPITDSTETTRYVAARDTAWSRAQEWHVRD